MAKQLSRAKYDPSEAHARAVDLLSGVSPEEVDAWYNNPITTSLRLSLEGDLMGIVLFWINGGYSDEEHSDGTAQRQAKARGMAQAIDDLLDRIEAIKNLELEESINNDQANRA